MLLSTRNALRRAVCPTKRGSWIDAPNLGYPRETKSIAHPFTRRDSATARQSCLGSARARPAVHAYLSMPRDLRARDASGRRMQSTFQRRAPDDSRGVRIRDRGCPRPHRRTVRAHRDRPLWPELRRPSRSFIPAWACHGTRSADASVTGQALQSRSLLNLIRPRSIPPPPNVMGFGFPDPRRLPSTEESSSDPFPIPSSAYPPGSVHERCFARGGDWPPEARSRPRPQPQPGAAS
jgi:hypothetical protein